MSETKLSPLFTWRSAVADKGSTLPPRCRHVALSLSLHMSERGDSAFPSLQTQADETGLNKRQVHEALTKLQKMGWLTIKKGGGRGNPNHYRAVIPESFIRQHPASVANYTNGAAVAPFVEQERVPNGSVNGANGGTGGRTPTQDVNQPPTSSSANGRPDVDRLCVLLANCIESNGSKRPHVTKRWHDACRLMMDRDGRSAEDVEAAIRWSQADDFWRANILSMPKLRDKFDTIRLQAQRSNGKTEYRPFANAPPTDYEEASI